MVVVALPQWWRQHPTSASTLTYGDRNIGASRQFHQSVIVAKVFIIIVVWNIYIYIYIYIWLNPLYVILALFVHNLCLWERLFTYQSLKTINVTTHKT